MSPAPHAPRSRFRTAKAGPWRIVLALIVAWSTLTMMTPTFAAAPAPAQHAMASAMDCAQMCALDHDMTGSEHQKCVVCTICASLAVSTLAKTAAPLARIFQAMVPPALTGLSRSPDHRPPIVSLLAT